ncbi:MAG TPA: cytochrome c [Edaphocola sp.]|nr:cytochrome c [Edaphocola sp.]
MKKVLSISLLLVVIVLTGSVMYLKFVLPDVGNAPVIKAPTDPAAVARGRYLANHVAVCMDCHSTRDWTRFSGPMVVNTLGKGGEYFGPEMGFPGKFYSRDISPAALRNWSDGEILRAFTAGVSKDGTALFPVMPYLYYGHISRQDALDIIAYLRTLKPIGNTIPKDDPHFPVNFLINTMPEKAHFTPKPPKSDMVAYGKYLVNMAACQECHTPADKGKLETDEAFSGGRIFKMPNGILRSANITPDKETGIGGWSETAFVARFKHYEDSSAAYLMPGDAVNTIMPWTMYAGMDTADLKAIYAYLKTLKPISKKVAHFSGQ